MVQPRSNVMVVVVVVAVVVVEEQSRDAKQMLACDSETTPFHTYCAQSLTRAR